MNVYLSQVVPKSFAFINVPGRIWTKNWGDTNTIYVGIHVHVQPQFTITELFTGLINVSCLFISCLAKIQPSFSKGYWQKSSDRSGHESMRRDRPFTARSSDTRCWPITTDGDILCWVGRPPPPWRRLRAPPFWHSICWCLLDWRTGQQGINECNYDKPSKWEHGAQAMEGDYHLPSRSCLSCLFFNGISITPSHSLRGPKSPARIDLYALAIRPTWPAVQATTATC